MTTPRSSRQVRALGGIMAIAFGILLLPSASSSRAAPVGSTPTQSASASPTPSVSPSSSPSASHSPSKSPTRSPSPTHSPSPSPSPSKSKSKPHKKPPGTTVTGPRLWNPASQRKFTHASTVTVSQTTNLVNEVVHVSWTGFTPSSNPFYDATATDYPVMVAECDTARPKFISQCYGANNGGIQGAFGPYGPENTTYATSAPNGTGQTDIQILTSEENQFLGCGPHHECSLVIVPAQGGNPFTNPVNCSDHSLDTGGSDLGQFAFISSTGKCSWRERIIVPLKFAPLPARCPINNTAFTVLGSPMMLRAMSQWRSYLCSAANPMTLIYNAQITEPAAVQDVPLGLGDVALTTRPGPVKSGKHTYAYAPISISAVSVAYWVDSPVTGQPVRTLKLNPRLLAKLLTVSYNFDNFGCGSGKPPKGIGCDGAVDNNPTNLFADPEFKQLNPKVQIPIGFGGAFQVPTVLSGHSDMTWEVTRWIAHDPAGSGFMKGQFDPWGMHINTNYLGVHYPTDSFTGQDNYPIIAHRYNPTFPLGASPNSVAGYQVQNSDPGTSWVKDQFGNFSRDQVEPPGERDLFAVLDQADAVAYRFPTAKLLNARGRYVAPSQKSMAAALPSLRDTSKAQKVTQDINFSNQKAGAYPLTMVIYAMVPTSGISAKKAAAIARFLNFITGPGQNPGVRPGTLPPGYLPLPAKFRAEAQRAASLVLAQKGNNPSSSPSPVSPSPSPSLSPTPSPTPSPSGGPHIAIIALKAQQSAGLVRYALPVLLIAGGLAALAGASSLITSTAGTAIVATLRRARRLRLVRRKQ